MRRWSLRFVFAVMAGAVAVGLAVGGLGTGSGRATAATDAGPGANAPSSRVLTVGRWRIRAMVRPKQVGPIALAVRNLKHEDKPRSFWLTHDFVFRNTAERSARFEDTRTSALIGPAKRRGLLAMDPGCGWLPAQHGRPIQAGLCDSVLIRLTAEPHARAKQSIAVEKGLQGMDPLVPGAYAFRQKVRFHLGTGGPRRGSKRVRIVYRVWPRTR